MREPYKALRVGKSFEWRYPQAVSVRVLYRQDQETWVASSPEVPRWTVVADTYAEARQLAEEGLLGSTLGGARESYSESYRLRQNSWRRDGPG